MKALAEAGDLAGMDLAFRKFQSLLHRELNLQPSHETVELCRRLRRGPPTVLLPAPAVTAGRLPIPLTPITGRESAIAEVSELLAHELWLVVLLGPEWSWQVAALPSR